MKTGKAILYTAVLLIVVVYLANTSWIASAPATGPSLLSHRGVHQTFSPIGIDRDTCTAERIYEPSHAYIENTIAGIGAAFDFGADIVEIDIHPTRDGAFVVFHDWTLGCRTNGSGVVREQTLSYLKTLDIGYGYTHDGVSFPLRGTAFGMMPTLSEVLLAFPDKRFALNIKSRDPREADALDRYLDDFPQIRAGQMIVIGKGAAIHRLEELRPEIRTLSAERAKACLKNYVLFGWTTHIPAACRDTIVGVPSNYTSVVWGFPNRFIKRMDSVGSDVFVFGPLKKGQANSGIDSLAALEDLPEGY